MASGAVIIDDDGSGDKRSPEIVKIQRQESDGNKSLDELTDPRPGHRIHVIRGTKLVSITPSNNGTTTDDPVSDPESVVISDANGPLLVINVFDIPELGQTFTVIGSSQQLQNNNQLVYFTQDSIIQVTVDGGDLDIGVPGPGVHLELQYDDA
jgi:hypothetical protein